MAFIKAFYKWIRLNDTIIPRVADNAINIPKWIKQNNWIELINETNN